MLKLKRDRHKIALCFVLALSLFLVSCGKKEDETSGLPTPAPPAEDTPEQPFQEPQQPEQDGRLPDLSRAVTISLDDTVNLTGLKEIAGNVFPKLVGDPLVAMNLQVDRSTGVSGSILLAFEDQIGFWGAQVRSFEGTGVFSSPVLDIIFADDELVIRVQGLLDGDTLRGNIFYRVRADGDDQCKPVVVTCEVVPPGPGPWPWNPQFPPRPPICDQEVDTVTPCRSYMSSNSVVKKLGSFEASFSNWITQ